MLTGRIILCCAFIGGVFFFEEVSAETMLTPPEVWREYDPQKGSFEEEVLKEWDAAGAHYKEVYFNAFINGQKIRVYGIYAAPIGGMNLPGVLHLHGGGQTVNPHWLREWTKRGYAALSCNYHGTWPDRKHFTIFPEALKQGNHLHAGNKRVATNPDVRSSSWYIWSALGRRTLTYLEQQKAVDPERLGIFGISMGGTTTWSLAMDPRVKAACAIYGCGWNRFYRDQYKYTRKPSPVSPSTSDRVWLAGMAPEAYPPYIKCPVLFLSSSNDHHGNMDRAYETLARLPESSISRQAFTPRFRHHIAPSHNEVLMRWMDWHLKRKKSLPQTPKTEVMLNETGVPILKVTPDQPQSVTRLEVYYALKNPFAPSRNWRSATATLRDGIWQAPLPVMDVSHYLFAFANVEYGKGVVLSSPLKAVIPARLGKARATEKPSRRIYAGPEGTGMWTVNSPGTDPIPGFERVNLKAATGPEGKKGFTVARRSFPITYQVGDPRWTGPGDASLQFEVATQKDQEFMVTVWENHFAKGSREYQARVKLEGQSGWQTINLKPDDFREKKSQAALAGWDRIDCLGLLCEKGQVWNDEKICFSNFEWK